MMKIQSRKKNHIMFQVDYRWIHSEYLKADLVLFFVVVFFFAEKQRHRILIAPSIGSSFQYLELSDLAQNTSQRIFHKQRKVESDIPILAAWQTDYTCVSPVLIDTSCQKRLLILKMQRNSTRPDFVVGGGQRSASIW